MAEMDDDLKFVKGFNQGYQLKVLGHGMYEHFQKGFAEKTPYTEGFDAGGKEYEKEQARQKIKDRMQQERDKERGR